MTTGEWVADAIAALGILLTLVVVLHGKTKDTKQDVSADESMRADVKYLVRGMDDIRADIKGHGKQLQNHERRLTRLETMNDVDVRDDE